MVRECDVMSCHVMRCDEGSARERRGEEDGMHSKREPTQWRVAGIKLLKCNFKKVTYSGNS